MFKYIIRRVLYFVPTLFVISLLAFGLSKYTPGDPCTPRVFENETSAGFINFKKDYENRCEMLGMSGPVFYFGISSQAYPDTLHKIIQRDERENWQKLISKYGNWDEISNYKNAIFDLQLKLFEVPDSIEKR